MRPDSAAGNAHETIVCYVAVAANIAPERNIAAALEELDRRVRVTAISTFYRTPAINRPEQSDYLNGVVGIETTMSSREVRCGMLRDIESKLGRTRTSDRYAARPIDLDLILYGDLVELDPDYVIPDPQIRERGFVGVPLAELVPDKILPGTDRRIADLFPAEARGSLRPDNAFTARLRDEWERRKG
jgi:2-amino-4-hydroxy-6-hydroxymethyldihydropteridine diphosphokinase